MAIKIGPCLDMEGGRAGIWSQERLTEFPGKLRVEAFGGEWSVSILDEGNGESLYAGVMRTSESYIVISNDLITKCFYRLDGQLEAIKLGISSLVNCSAQRGMDPHLVNANDWARLANLDEANEEIMFVLFLGDEEFSPYWCLQRVAEGMDRGPILEVGVVDPLLVSPKIKTDEPLFVQSLGGFDLKFWLMVDGYEVRFGVVDEDKNQIHAHAIRREVNFSYLGKRIRFDRTAKIEDLDGVLGQVSPGLKLLP